MPVSKTSLKNLKAGRNKSWQHVPTQAIRVPKVFVPQLLRRARRLDRGKADPAIDLEGLTLEELLSFKSRLSKQIEIEKESRRDRRLEQAIVWLAARNEFNDIDLKLGHWLAQEIADGRPLRQRLARRALEMLGKYDAILLEAGLSLPQWEAIDHQYPDQPLDDPLGEIERRLELRGEVIHHYSPYDPSELEKIRAIAPKGHFERSDKSWRFPLAAAPALLTEFGQYDYVDPAIHAIVLDLDRTEAYKNQHQIEAANKAAEILCDLIESAHLDQPLPCGWTLYQHQQEAVQWLLAHRQGGLYRGGILADHMGLGKTLSALVAAKALANHDPAAVFVVCPSSLRGNWMREAERVEVAIEVFSWAKAPKPLDSNPFLLIADEAHYAQNPKSARTKKLLALAEHENCRASWLLTGTPIKNGRPINLQPLLTAIAHPLVSDTWEYQRRYCDAHYKPIGRKSVWDNTGASHLDELAKKTEDAILRRTKADCLDLPQKQRILRPVEITNSQKKAYQTEIARLAADYRERVKRKEVAADAEALVMLGILRKVGSLYKIDAALEMTEQLLEQGQPVVIFTEYLESAHLLYSKLDNAELLTGKTKQAERQALVDRFQRGDSRVFIGTTKAGGVGLTLTAANTVILVDRPWTPGDAEQAEDRCHRIGQQNAVTAYWLQVGIVDEAVDTLLESKQKRIDLVLKGKRKTLRGIDSPKTLAMQLLEVL